MKACPGACWIGASDLLKEAEEHRLCDRFRGFLPIIINVETGGFIAHTDAIGLLKVGPQSAGSEPGPAAYGRGGTRPTVTDADFLLGYLDPKFFAGGTMAIDTAAIERAFASLAIGSIVLWWAGIYVHLPIVPIDKLKLLLKRKREKMTMTNRHNHLNWKLFEDGTSIILLHPSW